MCPILGRFRLLSKVTFGLATLQQLSEFMSNKNFDYKCVNMWMISLLMTHISLLFLAIDVDSYIFVELFIDYCIIFCMHV